MKTLRTLARSDCDILVFGTGSLASNFCQAFASAVKEHCCIKVYGRNEKKSRALAAISNSRNLLIGGEVKFDSGVVDWNEKQELLDIIAMERPKIIFLASSLQSPWEGDLEPSKWTSFVNASEYGVTLPLQALLAYKVARILKQCSHHSIFINGCYPDAVNPLLYSLKMPITAGIGNIAILDTLMRISMGVKHGDKDLKILAHHAHVKYWKPNSKIPGPKVWYKEQLIQRTSIHFSSIQNIKSSSLNSVTGATVVPLTLALLGNTDTFLHMPGPNGLPGGYPVNVSQNKVSVSSIAGVELSEMIAWNQTVAKADGVVVNEDGHVVFHGKAFSGLMKLAPSLAKGFMATDIENVAEEFLKLRTEMRMR